MIYFQNPHSRNCRNLPSRCHTHSSSLKYSTLVKARRSREGGNPEYTSTYKIAIPGKSQGSKKTMNISKVSFRPDTKNYDKPFDVKPKKTLFDLECNFRASAEYSPLPPTTSRGGNYSSISTSRDGRTCFGGRYV